jgi:hypothetical protein
MIVSFQIGKLDRATWEIHTCAHFSILVTVLAMLEIGDAAALAEPLCQIIDFLKRTCYEKNLSAIAKITRLWGMLELSLGIDPI